MATLAVKVVPGSNRDRVAGRYGDAVKIQVSAPPEDGKANKTVLRVLAEFLGVRPDQLTVARGHGQPRKVIAVRGLVQAAVDARVATLD
jgi:uncharacterized protein (TIGR00251 family)